MIRSLNGRMPDAISNGARLIESTIIPWFVGGSEVRALEHKSCHIRGVRRYLCGFKRGQIPGYNGYALPASFNRFKTDHGAIVLFIHRCRFESEKAQFVASIIIEPRRNTHQALPSNGGRRFDGNSEQMP